MKKLFSLLLALTLLCAAAIPALAEETDRAAALRAAFLAKADEVVVTDNSVIFPDAASETPLEIAKNPSKAAVLYGSFVTLWYEAGGVAAGVIGGISPMGGTGLLLGTFAGAAVWQTLENGLNMVGAQVGLQRIVIGVIVVSSVLLDVLVRNGGLSRKHMQK